MLKKNAKSHMEISLEKKQASRFVPSCHKNLNMNELTNQDMD